MPFWVASAWFLIKIRSPVTTVTPPTDEPLANDVANVPAAVVAVLTASLNPVPAATESTYALVAASKEPVPVAGSVTTPVKVGLAKLALRSSAVCCAVDTGLLASLVLSTLPKPTADLDTPVTVPVKVGDVNIVAFDSFVTLPSPTSELTSVTLPVLPATELTVLT